MSKGIWKVEGSLKKEIKTVDITGADVVRTLTGPNHFTKNGNKLSRDSAIYAAEKLAIFNAIPSTCKELREDAWIEYLSARDGIPKSEIKIEYRDSQVSARTLENKKTDFGLETFNERESYFFDGKDSSKKEFN